MRTTWHERRRGMQRHEYELKEEAGFRDSLKESARPVRNRGTIPISKETNKTMTINYRYQAGYEYYVLSLIFSGVRRRPQRKYWLGEIPNSATFKVNANVTTTIDWLGFVVTQYPTSNFPIPVTGLDPPVDHTTIWVWIVVVFMGWNRRDSV